MTVVQHFCKGMEKTVTTRDEPETENRFTVIIRHMSAARHFCVVIPNNFTEDTFLQYLEDSAVDILEQAACNSRKLPTSHCTDHPVI
jgi:hypothetical protein